MSAIGDRVVARFDPKHTETLKPSSLWFVGRVREYEFAWKITADDTPQYVGQDAWSIVLEPGDPTPDWFWVPTEDLQVVERGNDGREELCLTDATH